MSVWSFRHMKKPGREQVSGNGLQPGFYGIKGDAYIC